MAQTAFMLKIEASCAQIVNYGDHMARLDEFFGQMRADEPYTACDKCFHFILALPLPKTDPIQTVFHRKIGTFRLFICLINHGFAQGLANVRLFAENTQFWPHVSDKQGVISTKIRYLWSILGLNSEIIIKAF